MIGKVISLTIKAIAGIFKRNANSLNEPISNQEANQSAVSLLVLGLLIYLIIQFFRFFVFNI
tara:strand:- start:163 stop:348 length:186 start_codon:yes stop_codon:yes gene_type:complete